MASSEKPNGEQALEPEISEILEDVTEPVEEEVVELDPLAEAEAKANEYLTLAQRTRADLENFRRRTAKEREELLRFGTESVLTDVLGVLDDVERAQEHAADDSALSEGFRMLHAGLMKLLERHHVSEVPGVGAPFDPNFHNAIQQVESDAVEKGQVAEVYQKGYMLHDRVIRAAMVAVAS